MPPVDRAAGPFERADDRPEVSRGGGVAQRDVLADVEVLQVEVLRALAGDGRRRLAQRVPGEAGRGREVDPEERPEQRDVDATCAVAGGGRVPDLDPVQADEGEPEAEAVVAEADPGLRQVDLEGEVVEADGVQGVPGRVEGEVQPGLGELDEVAEHLAEGQVPEPDGEDRVLPVARVAEASTRTPSTSIAGEQLELGAGRRRGGAAAAGWPDRATGSVTRISYAAGTGAGACLLRVTLKPMESSAMPNRVGGFAVKSRAMSDAVGLVAVLITRSVIRTDA